MCQTNVALANFTYHHILNEDIDRVVVEKCVHGWMLMMIVMIHLMYTVHVVIGRRRDAAS